MLATATWMRLGFFVCVIIICSASVTQSLNQSYIRLTSDRLSRRLASFTDTVLHTRDLRDIYTSVDYDIFDINADQVVSELSNTLGKLASTGCSYIWLWRAGSAFRRICWLVRSFDNIQCLTRSRLKCTGSRRSLVGGEVTWRTGHSGSVRVYNCCSHCYHWPTGVRCTLRTLFLRLSNVMQRNLNLISVELLFVFVAELFANALTATRMLADKVVSVYSQQQQQQSIKPLGKLHNITVGASRPTRTR